MSQASHQLSTQEGLDSEAAADKDDPLREIHHLMTIQEAVDRVQKQIDILAKLFNCDICGLLMYKPTLLSCGHSFCRTCIWTHLTNKRRCPHRPCRKGIAEPRPISLNFAVQNMINTLVSAMQPEQRQQFADRGRDNDWRNLRLQRATGPMRGLVQGMADQAFLAIPLGDREAWRHRWRRLRRRGRPPPQTLPPLRRPANLVIFP